MTEIEALKEARRVMFIHPHPDGMRYRTPAGVDVGAEHKGRKRVDIVALLRCVANNDENVVQKAVTRLQSVIGKADLRSWGNPDVARALETAANGAGA
jgi:hypothetical protein